VLENQKIEKIFEIILPLKHLQGLFLAGNHILTRDLNFIKGLGGSLRKLDLSFNKIAFLPDYDTFKWMHCLEFLLL
jgi:Leucine-rich repeat (LRR) protein